MVLGKNFKHPDTDLPSLDGKVIFVTGGTAGLGKASIQALAKHNPAHIYFTGRNTKSAESVISEIKDTAPSVGITFIQCELDSLESIRSGITKFTHSRLDVLLCNAGVMAQPPGVSKDGYETHFAINHLGHALVIKHLLPTLIKTAEEPGSDVRIVSITSVAWRAHPKEGIQFSTLKSPQDFGFPWSFLRLGSSKLANIVYAAELARRYPNITCVSLHPGVGKTPMIQNLDFWNKLLVYVSNLGPPPTPEHVVLNQLWASAGAKKDELANGGFYMPVGDLSTSKLDKVAKSENLATDLWSYTENALKDF